MNLQIAELENIEAPISDMEWGIIVGAALSIGVAIGIT